MLKRMIITGAVLLLLVMGVAPAAAQEDVCMQQGGNWDATTGTCVIGATIDVKITYPIEFAQYDFAKQAIDQVLTDQRAAFFAPINEYGFTPSPGPLTLQIDYETTSFSPDIVSVKFTTYAFTGGAHGMTTFNTLTFDLANSRVLTLDDLFVAGTSPLDVIAPMAQQDLQGTLGEMTDAKWLADGTAPTAENYQNWVLTPDSLVFTFPQYQVAAYAAGPQEVTIPLAALGGLLAAPFSGM